MKLFIDTANLVDIEKALDMGFCGVTTNPSLMAKEPKGDYEKHLRKIVAMLRNYEESSGDNPSLSVEIFTNDKEEIIKQAKKFYEFLDYDSLAIKIHISYEGQGSLSVIRKLYIEGIDVNCTACMSVSQAVLASQAGAKYVSLFWGRIRDGGGDPAEVVTKSKKIIGDNSEIIVGSIRKVEDIIDALVCGADIVTVPPKFLPEMTQHVKTDEVVGQFFKDFELWLK